MSDGADGQAIDPKEERRRIRAWQFYDWGNSAFATVMVTACLPIYFRKVCTAGLPQESASLATALWGATSSISMALVAVAALVLGPLSDATARKKRCLFAFAALGVSASILIAVCPPQLWWMISLLFILGNLGFGGGNVFYDALLPAVATREKLDRVSSVGYAMGYLGGGLLLGLCLIPVLFLPMQRIHGGLSVAGLRVSFIAVAVWWTIFAIPLFRRVPEPHAAGEAAPFAIGLAWRRLAQTARDIGRYKDAVKFLIAFWLYSDGFGTIVKMAVIYAEEIFAQRRQDPAPHLITVILLVQFVGVPCTLLWERAARRTGAKAAVMACLVIYGIICVFAYFMTEIWQFYALGLAVALVQGGTQALSRSLFATLAPKGKEAEFFGFYNISGKFAGVLGPALMSVIGASVGSSRPAILSLIVFFIIGAGVLATVRFDNAAERRR